MIGKMIDAAYPPATVPPGVVAVAGYIGGARATNIWTPAEWQPFGHLRQIPIWVPPLNSDPAAEAGKAVAAAKALGWAAHMPDTRVIVGDLETAAVPAWWETFAGTIGAGGFIAMAYGSLSTVLLNAAVDVWAADWDNLPELLPGQTIHAKQDQPGVRYGNTLLDYSVIDEWLLAHGGIGPRRA
jgi:hypothetical protein